jgi:hypothetical protein
MEFHRLNSVVSPPRKSRPVAHGYWPSKRKEYPWRIPSRTQRIDRGEPTLPETVSPVVGLGMMATRPPGLMVIND